LFQRSAGAKKRLNITIVRSMNMRLDDFPHTGTMGYGDLPKSDYIPAAISTNGAELLSKSLKKI
jgi:hypothetical protein